MKKNHIYPLLFFLSFSTFVSAQQPAHTHISIDSRLYEVFETGYLNDLITENPFLIQRWNFYLDNSWYITDLPKEKAKATYPVISIGDIDNINIFRIEKENDIKRDWNRQEVYQLEGQGKALVMVSGKEFTKRLNKHLNR